MHWDIPRPVRPGVCAGLSTAAGAAPTTWSESVSTRGRSTTGCCATGAAVGAAPLPRRSDARAASTPCTPSSAPPSCIARNGLQFLPFNTVYQLAAERDRGHARRWPTRVLLVPDLINYWLTGRAGRGAHERVDHRAARCRRHVGRRADGPASVARRPVPRHRRARQHSWDRCCPTSGAAAAAPSGLRWCRWHPTTPLRPSSRSPCDPISAAYISCGTWGLVGRRASAALVTDASRQADFTNEVGADGRVRFLHNVMGTWLLSETVRQYERGGASVEPPARCWSRPHRRPRRRQYSTPTTRGSFRPATFRAGSRRGTANVGCRPRPARRRWCGRSSKALPRRSRDGVVAAAELSACRCQHRAHRRRRSAEPAAVPADR